MVLAGPPEHPGSGGLPAAGRILGGMSSPRPPRAPRAIGARLERARRASIARSRDRFRRLLSDPRGLAFALAFVDRVIRPDDPRVAATALERLSRRLPDALPAPLRVGLTLAGGLGLLLPAPAMALVRRGFAREVRHLAPIRPRELPESVGPLVRALAAEAGVPLLDADGSRPPAAPAAPRLASVADARVTPPAAVRVVAEGTLGPESVADLRDALPDARVDLIDDAAADADPDVPLVVAGSAARARQVRERYPGARVLHRPAAASVAVVTPAADLERAAADLVATARADRDRGVATPTRVILVGSAAGPRFRAALADAARADVDGTRLEFEEVDGRDAAAARQAELADGASLLLYSLDPIEIEDWLTRAEGRTLTVNAAAVESTPVAWGELAALGTWTDAPAEVGEELRLDGLDERVRWVIEAFQPALGFDAFSRVRAAALSDEEAWDREFGVAVPVPSAAGVRRATRYRPAAVDIRLGADGALADLARVLAAGVRARARLRVSAAVPVPAAVLELADDGTPLGRSLIGLDRVDVEPVEAWLERGRADDLAGRGTRVRVIGERIGDVERASLAGCDVRLDPVTASGRVELPMFLRPQRVTIATARFGIVDPAFEALRL